MVNTGKPSRGCYTCRARRIKCDEGKPDCMRCIKSKRVCPGYRDAFELKLRDESKSTKKKQLTRRTSQPFSTTEDPAYSSFSFNSQPSSSSICYPSPEHSRRQSINSRSGSQASVCGPHNYSPKTSAAIDQFRHPPSFISAQLTTPIHQQAACYFLTNFVLIPERGTMRGYLDFVIPLLKKREPAKTLSAAFSAVAFAALGTRPNSKALLPKADLWYLKALKEINAALQNPETASDDATIASVMLMSSYEQLTPSRSKIGGWASHIDGAVAVIKSRPKDRWKDQVSKDLFIAVRAHMTIHCIANSRKVDPCVEWLGVQAQDNIIQSFAAVNIKMAALRADNDLATSLKDHTPANTETVVALIQRAENLEQEYLAWLDALPPSWAITTVDWVGDIGGDLSNSIVHPGRVDAYGELWMVYKYNIVRACRINIQNTILRCIAWLRDPQDYRFTPEYAAATHVCRQLIEDIVATVPYFFGWNRDKNIAMADRSNFACGTNDFTTTKPLAGLFGMWPFFTAATSDFSSPSQVQFLRGRLKYIAETMGINQAGILFQAQFKFPSMVIMRERFRLPVGGEEALCQKMERYASESPPRDIPLLVVVPIQNQTRHQTLLSPPKSGQQWVPRSFKETQMVDDATANALMWDLRRPPTPGEVNIKKFDAFEG